MNMATQVSKLLT